MNVNVNANENGTVNGTGIVPGAGAETGAASASVVARGITTTTTTGATDPQSGPLTAVVGPTPAVRAEAVLCWDCPDSLCQVLNPRLEAAAQPVKVSRPLSALPLVVVVAHQHLGTKSRKTLLRQSSLVRSSTMICSRRFAGTRIRSGPFRKSNQIYALN